MSLQRCREHRVTLSTLRLAPKKLRFHADYVILHCIVEHTMVVVIAVIVTVTRATSTDAPVPLADAISQSASLAAVQLAMVFITNVAAMHYESWAGLPVGASCLGWGGGGVGGC